MAMVWTLAASAWVLPAMWSDRLAPTSAVEAMFGHEPCTAPRSPRNGTTSLEIVRAAVTGGAGGDAAARATSGSMAVLMGYPSLRLAAGLIRPSGSRWTSTGNSDGGEPNECRVLGRCRYAGRSDDPDRRGHDRDRACDLPHRRRSGPMVPTSFAEDRSSPSAGHGTPLVRNVGILAGQL